MRIYFQNKEYISYPLDTTTKINKIPITNDITEKNELLNIVFIFSKDNEVIGKTNIISILVEKNYDKDKEPLTPREQFDEVIRE